MDLAQQPDAAILAVVEPIMDNLMDASTAIDYERHVRDFTERARSVLPVSTSPCHRALWYRSLRHRWNGTPKV